MRFDTIIMIVVTTAIGAILAACYWVLNLDTRTPLSVLGVLTAVSLPYYIYRRLRKNEANRLILWDCVRELSFLQEDVKGKDNKAKIKNVIDTLEEMGG